MLTPCAITRNIGATITHLLRQLRMMKTVSINYSTDTCIRKQLLLLYSAYATSFSSLCACYATYLCLSLIVERSDIEPPKIQSRPRGLGFFLFRRKGGLVSKPSKLLTQSSSKYSTGTKCVTDTTNHLPVLSPFLYFTNSNGPFTFQLTPCLADTKTLKALLSY